MTQMTWIACLLVGGLAGWLTAAVKKQRIIDGLQAEIDDSIPRSTVMKSLNGNMISYKRKDKDARYWNGAIEAIRRDLFQAKKEWPK